MSLINYFSFFHEKSLTKYRCINTYTSSGFGCYSFLCSDLLSTNFLRMKADCYHRFTDWALYFDNALHCSWISIEQSFIFTTWTSHMHFLHFFSPPVRGQSKGNVKLTVDYSFVFHCTVFRDFVPKVAINTIYRTFVLLSIDIYIAFKSFDEVFFAIKNCYSPHSASGKSPKAML